jgi:hypothetical protein
MGEQNYTLSGRKKTMCLYNTKKECEFQAA